jgi:V8-like Glu-specific endopeptidase
MKGYIPDIIQEVKSGIIHIVHVVDRVDEKGEKHRERVSSGTGFMFNGCLVTNHHVINGARKDSKIVLRTSDSNLNKPLEGVIELERTIVGGEFNGDTNKGKIRDFNKWTELTEKFDYVVYDIPELRTLDLYNFQLDSYKSKREGEEILFIGYHFDENRIISHRGFISSFYNSNGVDKIQIDASVNNGSSGSPLLDPNTSRVIGIITRKETGLLNNRFEQLRLLTQESQKKLSGFPHRSPMIVRGNHGFYDLLYEHNIRNAQIAELIQNIERSANVGIGYAYSVEHLMKQNFYIEG